METGFLMCSLSIGWFSKKVVEVHLGKYSFVFNLAGEGGVTDAINLIELYKNTWRI